MPRSWTELDERTQGDRDRERAAREIARRTRVSRKANRRPPWLYALALATVIVGIMVSVLAPFGELSGFATALLILAGAALVA